MSWKSQRTEMNDGQLLGERNIDTFFLPPCAALLQKDSGQSTTSMYFLGFAINSRPNSKLNPLLSIFNSSWRKEKNLKEKNGIYCGSSWRGARFECAYYFIDSHSAPAMRDWPRHPEL